MKLLYKIIYVWHLIAKVISYASFGGCSLIFSSIGFPLIFVLVGFSKKRFEVVARFISYYYFKSFVLEMHLLGILTVKVDHAERLKDISSSVVIANHPSLLDVVVLYSLIPRATCIVKGSLGTTPFIKGVVNTLYIPNSLPFEEQLEKAKQSMDAGNSLFIFPEGTRTIPGKPLDFKKGAARFALYAKKKIVPIYFGGNEKIGLRKHDKYFSFHPTERYHYDLDVLEPISTEEFWNLPNSIGVIHLTQRMLKTFEDRKALDKSQAN